MSEPETTEGCRDEDCPDMGYVDLDGYCLEHWRVEDARRKAEHRKLHPHWRQRAALRQPAREEGE